MNPLDGCETVAQGLEIRKEQAWDNKQFAWHISTANIHSTLRTVLLEWAAV
jgi:hypothetical protein